jgi:response regulator RpfG family c-di-GMP phosphodiesterase
MFYILFIFFFSFVLCASQHIEEIIQRKILRILYIDDSTVNLKMTRRAVETYNAKNASSQIELTTRSHGDNLMPSELATQHMVWCDIQMSPYLSGNVVLANLKIQHPDFEHPPFIAVTSEPDYHDSDEELSQHARDHHFIAGRDKIKTPDDIQVVLKVYYGWLEKQKEKTHLLSFDNKFIGNNEQSRTAWRVMDARDEDAEEFVNSLSPRVIPPEKETGNDSAEHSTKKPIHDPDNNQDTKKRTAKKDLRKVSPHEQADLSHEPNDEDDTGLSCFCKCLERLENRLGSWSQLTGLC